MVTLYTYYCVDGTVRTRCRRHIEREGPYAILPFGQAIFHRKDIDQPERCIMCRWEMDHGIYPIELEGQDHD